MISSHIIKSIDTCYEKLYRTISLCIFLLYPSLSNSSELENFYIETIRTSPSSIAAKANRRADIELITMARSNLLPTITLTSGYQTREAIQPDRPDFERNAIQNSMTAINFSQPLFNIPSWIAYKNASIKKSRSDLALSMEDRKTALLCAQIYMDALDTRFLIAQLEAEEDVAAEQLRIATESFAKGEIGTLALLDSKSSYFFSESALSDVRRTMKRLNSEITALSGISMQFDTFRSRTRPSLELNLSESFWTSSAHSNNLEILDQTHHLAEMLNNIRIHKAARLPTVALNLSHGHIVSNTRSSPHYEQSSIHLQMSIPLYTGGRNRAKIREAVARFEAGEADLLATEKITNSSIKALLNNAEDDLAYLKPLKYSLMVSNQKLLATKIAHHKGEYTRLAILNDVAKVAKLEAEIARTENAIFISHLKLKSLAGIITTKDLAR